MTLAALNTRCAALPGAEVSQPFGEGVDVWKIGGKIFAAVSDQGVCVKTDSVEAAELLIAAGVGRKAPYFHRSWLQLPPDADPTELAHRIATSHALIRAALPKKLAATLLPPAP